MCYEINVRKNADIKRRSRGFGFCCELLALGNICVNSFLPVVIGRSVVVFRESPWSYWSAVLHI